MALYKFQNANMNSLTALKAHSLYFSELDKFNDPTESMFGLLPSEKKGWTKKKAGHPHI